MKRTVWRSSATLVAILGLALGSTAPQSHQQASPPLLLAQPASVGMSAERLAAIDDVVRDAIAQGQLPGAVILVARRGRIVYRKAFGHRALQPERLPMTLDTVFDLASLTKVVATATSIMILAERGLIRLGDRVSTYIPEFGRNGKQSITIEQLLTHRGGLLPDNDLADYQRGPEEALQRIYSLSPIYEPGTRFVYSDVGYIVLGELVRRVSGLRLDAFAHRYIFRPLGMHHTMFLPNAQLRAKAAPTEKRDGRWLIGEVHDPRAFLLGGVAGHAGLFSTADDLAIYCQMILNGGQYNGVRILSPLGVRRMTSARGLPPNEWRGLGWDINTRYSSNRGDFFPIGSFGHTGFTGTSVWIDPQTGTFVIFLSNRVHPDGKGDVVSLRGRVASIVAASIIADVPPQGEREREPGHGRTASQRPLLMTLTGIDVLQRENFAPLNGRRVGLITNQTGRDGQGRRTIDLFYRAPNVALVAIFSPEHGIRGRAEGPISHSRDEATGVPIYSLYGEHRKPTPDMLRGIDTLVFDIQDVGARFYTYITTMGYAMEAAARAGIRFVVLDRPNPINGVDVEGPLADEDLLSFTAYYPLPVRHGMTVGELATLFKGEKHLDLDLEVIPMRGWSRWAWYDDTGLVWINPSPNMRSLVAATLYPGIGLLESTNLSVGRGTDRPFEFIGAPWLDGRRLARRLNEAGLPGVRFVPVEFTPTKSTFAGRRCHGVHIIVTDRRRFHPVRCGLEIAVALRELYPQKWDVERFLRLLANKAVWRALKEGASTASLSALWQSDVERFLRVRRKYLIYR
ncbi:MAG: DUF1343 domain-containing protein [Acidobacteria bacterium]|nr:MAG: DUF1343 domain-containing protein [Acidobacteriota bacterium]